MNRNDLLEKKPFYLLANPKIIFNAQTNQRMMMDDQFLCNYYLLNDGFMLIKYPFPGAHIKFSECVLKEGRS
jgi:hypothetical protein